MKQFLLTMVAAGIAATSFAQAVPNEGMENWRSNTAGTMPPVNIYAPVSWYGFDSTIIANAQSFIPGDYHAQLFQEMDTVHAGTSSAKVLTLGQGTFGVIGGVLSNARIDLDVLAIIGGADPLTALSYSGGAATTLRTQTVSAYVKYLPGLDTTTHLMGGPDTGSLIVQAIHSIGGYDSVIGTGIVNILPSETFTQITANIIYADTFYTTQTVRIVFSSSKLDGYALDSSTLYVDDITMTGVPQTGGPISIGVKQVTNGDNAVKVFPNPASTTLHLSSPGYTGLTATLLTVSGQAVASKQLTGNDAIDISHLAAGTYIYTITAGNGVAIKHGTVNIVR